MLVLAALTAVDANNIDAAIAHALTPARRRRPALVFIMLMSPSSSVDHAVPVEHHVVDDHTASTISRGIERRDNKSELDA